MDSGLLGGVALLVGSLAAAATAWFGRKASHAKAVSEEAAAQRVATDASLDSLGAALKRADDDVSRLRCRVENLERRLNEERRSCEEQLHVLRSRIRELETAA